MRQIKRTTLTAASLTLLLTAVLTACSNSSPTSSNSAAPTASGKASPDAASPSASTQEAADPMGKYEPTLTISAARFVDPGTIFDAGEDINNNVWTKEFESALGIKIAYDWTTVKAEDYVNKLNVSIASGDKLPDLFPVNATQLQQLAEAGELADLTDVYERYATPLTKELLSGDGGVGLKSATYKGKLYALPQLAGNIASNDVLWIREDWLKNVGLPAPKSIDDLVAIADAFVNKDPNRSGKKDTLGLGLSMGPVLIGGGVADLGGFFAGFKAYPDRWVKDASGKLVYGSVQPETKAALAKLQEMYKTGLIDKEWAVKDGGKIGEDIMNNKIGMWYGAVWNGLWPVDVTKNEGLINLKPYSIVSVDGHPRVVQAVDASVGSTFDPRYFVMRKGYEHPEAIVKLMNLSTERFFGETADNEKYGTGPKGTTYFKYPLVQSWKVDKDVPTNLDAVRDALSTGDASKLNSEQKTLYDFIKAFEEGDIKGFGNARLFDGFDILKQDNLNNQLISGFYGAPTPTMVEKKSSLDKLETTAFTKIIMGSASIDDFDKFVSDWYKLGGEQMTKEVNDWQAAQQP